MRRNQRAVVGLVAGAGLFIAGGVTAGRFVKSPAQVIADTAPPAPTVLTATVQKRTITTQVVLTGSAVRPGTLAITAGSASSTDSSSRPIVTRQPARVGEQVPAGTVVAEVSGRPIFVLHGRIPAYRDLRPASQGRDVAELQSALEQQGFSSGTDPHGYYGAGTKEAVSRFYSAIGYQPEPTSPDDADQVQQARQSVVMAERAVRNARISLSQTRGASRRQAELEVSDAETDLGYAEQTESQVIRETGPMVPAGEVVFADHFPLTVTAVDAHLGSAATGALLHVSAGQLAIVGGAQPTDAAALHAGQHVALLSQTSGKRYRGVLTSVGKQPVTATTGGTSNGGNDGTTGAPLTGLYKVVVRPNQPLPNSEGTAVFRITIDAASSQTPVLVVPLSAVYTDVDGRTTVRVVTSGGEHAMSVRTGIIADGDVQVTPTGSDLTPGLKVEIGSSTGS